MSDLCGVNTTCLVCGHNFSDEKHQQDCLNAMMKEITIHGHSDDLIEIDGPINEEIQANFDKPTTFAVGDWKFMAEYNGDWHFIVLEHPHGVIWDHLPVGEFEKFNDYTEVLRITAKNPTVEKIK